MIKSKNKLIISLSPLFFLFSLISLSTSKINSLECCLDGRQRFSMAMLYSTPYCPGLCHPTYQNPRGDSHRPPWSRQGLFIFQHSRLHCNLSGRSTPERSFTISFGKPSLHKIKAEITPSGPASLFTSPAAGAKTHQQSLVFSPVTVHTPL